ncbi:class 1 fructose-bisphosphatase [Puniceibacterium sediminis]|uniref:Fructose-1,6-bisphosphatase class 1 n=1 Tax=Puniceibacterium sediminis TaxID=1608407 RepID=A0A238VV87_9RHOB|nr:class 1 fructose-bisphosphatase [Puniceibacterium sediminis]SNR37409.1 D-fructose 1,6-bisphosphatase [Puniceibacterium sediminis]
MTAITLRRHLTDAGHDSDLIFLLEDIASACRSTAYEVRNGPLKGNLGVADSINVQGEDQKPLDIIANDIFVSTCANSPRLAALVSEEIEEVVWLKEPKKGDYMLFFDPLDGSSNLDTNLSVGTIFSIMQIEEDGNRNVLRRGADQLVAGYALYGPATMMVLAAGRGVQGFTLHQGTGIFRLTQPSMSIPETTNEFAINTARRRFWDQPIRDYVDDCLAGTEGPRGKDFNMRWVASMVAEVHRVLMRGGVFLYPLDDKNRAAGGRLRLLYEVAPMAKIIEAAGGAASTGTERILDLVPTEPHQRVATILGSREEVALLEQMHRKPAEA